MKAVILGAVAVGLLIAMVMVGVAAVLEEVRQL